MKHTQGGKFEFLTLKGGPKALIQLNRAKSTSISKNSTGTRLSDTPRPWTTPPTSPQIAFSRIINWIPSRSISQASSPSTKLRFSQRRQRCYSKIQTLSKDRSRRSLGTLITIKTQGWRPVTQHWDFSRWVQTCLWILIFGIWTILMCLNRHWVLLHQCARRLSTIKTQKSWQQASTMAQFPSLTWESEIQKVSPSQAKPPSSNNPITIQSTISSGLPTENPETNLSPPLLTEDFSGGTQESSTKVQSTSSPSNSTPTTPAQRLSAALESNTTLMPAHWSTW